MSRTKLNDLNWCFPPLASFLGCLGGWHWVLIRRIGISLTGGLLGFGYGINIWKAVLYAICTWTVFSLPYSPDRIAWPVIAIVGATYGMTPWLMDFKVKRLWWPTLTGLTLAGLLWISSIVPWWTHKWTETIVFGLHGFLVSWTIDKAKDKAKER